MNDPSDGLIVFMQNFVNATMNDNGQFVHGSKPKHFCIYNVSQYAKNCKGGRTETNAADVLVVAQDAPYHTPHMVENVDRWTSLTTSRNKN